MVTGLVVAISTGDDYLHVGTADALLSHHPEQELLPDAGLDFFDSLGTALELSVGSPTAGVGLSEVDSRPDPDAVLGRIGRVLERAQLALDSDPELGRTSEGEYVTQVPRPAGDLAAVLAALHAECGLDDSSEHSAGWFHNLMHRVG